ncbi:MAG: hypothetical protein GY946_02640 [bacterium]|nr:hypothetical protein [bacterium]
MFELKPLHHAAVLAAIEKAKHYRLLNEPIGAESICLDVLELEPDNTPALETLLLALTDQFPRRLGDKFSQARALLARFSDEYNQKYYAGILCERRAMVGLGRDEPGSDHVAYEWFRQAMDHYEAAMDVRPDDNDDTILRWNTCARILNRNPKVVPRVDDEANYMLE